MSLCCAAYRKVTRGEKRHICGETGHTGDQEPAGEDQQHPRALRGRCEYCHTTVRPTTWIYTRSDLIIAYNHSYHVQDKRRLKLLKLLF